jgi:autotransporter-associated beta strand protein
MILANSSNDWSGDTTIGNGRIRVGGAGEVLPDGAGKGNVTLLGEGTAGRPTILTLDGHVETVNGLSSSGTDSEAFVTNQATVDATLRVGANGATSTFGGTVTDDPAFGGKLHVTKLGAGTFTMTGLNAYTGDTRVFGGTLSISSANLAFASDVQLTAGATFDLNFVGTNSIDSLYINGVGQATGTWGSPTSTATNKSAFFTGTGLLQVNTVGAPLLPGDFDGDKDVDLADLAQWRRDFGVNGGSDANYDGDSDGGDFLIWQRNLGMTIPGVAAGGAVPEPGALALAGLAAIGLGASRRRRW